MSVYTPIYQHDLEYLFKNYTIDQVIEFSGVEDGIENTTYFVTTEKEKETSEWVLTIFEHFTIKELPPYVQLLSYLSQSGLPIPNPVCSATGESIHVIHSKPAIIAPKLSGTHVATALASHCHQIGAALAKLHTETKSYPHPFHSARDFAWIQSESKALITKISESQQKTLLESIHLCQHKLKPFAQLPRAIVHGDLFIDNTLFEKGQLTGIIDFYSAGKDYMLMDVAVALNDWCVDPMGLLENIKVEALIEGYQSVRPLTPLEHTAMPIFLLLAALRFWVYRLKVQVQNREEGRQGDTMTFKDPSWFEEMIKLRRKSIL